MHAVRESLTANWKDPAPESLTPAPTVLGSLGLKGLKLYFWNVDLDSPTASANAYVATRPALKSGFSPGVLFPSDATSPPVITENDDGAFYAKYLTTDAGALQFLFRATVNANRSGNEVQIPNLHTNGLDYSPIVNSNETVIYFASTRTPGQGAADIWRSERGAKTDDWGTPVNMAELSSAGPDEPSWVSNDDCVMLFDRASHVFMAQRPL
jgi:hypothetical protein